jgi:hypothetical protein
MESQTSSQDGREKGWRMPKVREHYITVFQRWQMCPHKHRTAATAQRCIDRSGDKDRQVIRITERHKWLTVEIASVEPDGSALTFYTSQTVPEYLDSAGLSSKQIRQLGRLRKDQQKAERKNARSVHEERKAAQCQPLANVIPFDSAARLNTQLRQSEGGAQ